LVPGPGKDHEILTSWTLEPGRLEIGTITILSGMQLSSRHVASFPRAWSVSHGRKKPVYQHSIRAIVGVGAAPARTAVR